MFLRKFTLWLYLLLFISCHHESEKITKVILLSADNKEEITRVIEHERNLGDNRKIRAAEFLISNMSDKYFLDGDEINSYNSIFSVFAIYHKRKQFIYKNSPVIQSKWDSILSIYGHPVLDEMERVQDYHKIKSNFLINNIDSAFLDYKGKWGKHLSFDQFCEYLLPYRNYNEKLEPWRGILYSTYKPLFDSVRNKGIYQAVESVNTALERILDTNHTLWDYPFDISTTNMLLGRRGSCKQVVSHTALIFRANGIPVGIDYTPLWGDRPNGHYWNNVILENGKNFSFEAASIPFGAVKKFPYRLAKVYRRTFGIQKSEVPDNMNEVPENLLDNRRIDITEEYTKSYDIVVPLLRVQQALTTKNAVICTFGKQEWKAQDWGKVISGKSYFKKIGSNILYIVMYYKNGEYIPASMPFILTKDGKLNFINPNFRETQSVKLTRKNPNWPVNIKNNEMSLGIRFQGANKSDFSDSIDIYTINEIPTGFEEIKVSSSKKFKYVRMISQQKKNAVIAELEFYVKRNNQKETLVKDGKIIGYPKVTDDAGTPYKNAFDGNPETYFMGGKKTAGWTGLVLKQPSRITKIRYCPRSDTNFILVGDTYELVIWNGMRWVSLGKKIALKQELVYRNVPKNSLMLLHNLSRGNEERIFTYQKEKQVWW
ncbi:hypothetical protein [Pedobacter punctiformis]|uniref:Transglutaminase-like domain-containing protein n=1 Tax=Pedobacter punctiformis TaxID=3004097 RepID=A0ABT4L7A2_9SPHI|nr:hypothetical protein [Pedobacter sp. HCMS5-2]MCZ4243803.1 hypothetical protein [Pedobacter sp. HCMS5-2]